VLKQVSGFGLFFLVASAGASGGGAWQSESARRDEPLAIIVNRENQVENLGFNELRRIFMLEQSHWSNGTKITVVMRRREDPERAAILRLVYRMNEAQYSRFILQRTFTGEAPAVPKTTSTSLVMKKFIAYVPGAIGYVRGDEMDDSVKAIRIDNRGVGDAAYRLKLQVR
jgi:ABC-type phosphate transport system substrate-binding protein